MKLKVEAKGFEELRGKLHDPELLRKPVRDLMYHAGGIGKKASKEAIDGGTGIAVRSIRSQVRPASAEVFSLIAHDRAVSIEEGRKPGEVIPFMSAARWVTGRTRGFSPSADERQQALSVIARVKLAGAKGKRFIGAAHDKVQEELPRLIDEVVAKVKARLRQ